MTGGVLAFRCLGTAIPSGLEGSDLEFGRALVRALGDPPSDLKEIRQPHGRGELRAGVENDADPDCSQLSLSPPGYVDCANGE